MGTQSMCAKPSNDPTSTSYLTNQTPTKSRGILGGILARASERRIVILRLKEVQARIGLGRSAIYYLMDKNNPRHDPSFPRSIKISSHAIGFIEAEVDAWLELRIAARDSSAQQHIGSR